MKGRLLPLLVWMWMASAAADSQHDKDIEVKVEVAGETAIVDVSLAIPATRQQVWDVLTDFEHMAAFITNLKESKVISNAGDTRIIYQRGTAKHGPITFPFHSTRELRLTPLDNIQSHLISGSMRKMDGVTKLIVEEGQTRIIYHAESIPGMWIPPVVGKAFIEHETREQFQEIRDEIMRRKQLPVSGS